MSWEPVAFNCDRCGASRPNPNAKHEDGVFRQIVNVSEPRDCDMCALRSIRVEILVPAPKCEKHPSGCLCHLLGDG